MPATGDHRSAAVSDAVREIEGFASDAGWDAPVRLFALVDTAEAAAGDPGFAATITPDGTAGLPPGHLTPVVQDELPEAESVEELLARIAWPESVAGAAVVLERVLLAHDDGAAVGPSEVLSSPDRRDVRIAAGVLRTGESWCVLRLRDHDDPAMRIQGEAVVPALVEELSATFAPAEPGGE